LLLYSSYFPLGVPNWTVKNYQHLAASAPLLECHTASKHHLLEYCLFPTGRLNLGFITEAKLAAIFIKPSLGVSNWPVILLHQLHAYKFSGIIITTPSATPCSGKELRTLQERCSQGTNTLCWLLGIVFRIKSTS
jgi:hypothetical protein